MRLWLPKERSYKRLWEKLGSAVADYCGRRTGLQAPWCLELCRTTLKKEGAVRIHGHAFFSSDQGFVPGKALAAAFKGFGDGIHYAPTLTTKRKKQVADYIVAS